MPFRRGFRAYASRRSAEFRHELGLGPLDPFDPLAAAAYLAIPVIAFGDVPNCEPETVEVLRAGKAVSAMTIFCGTARIIVYNDGHTVARTHNSISHEIAHAMLLHEPAPAIGLFGCRNVNRDDEEEADYLAGALLLPEEITLHVVRLGLADEEIARRYCVSEELVRYRCNVTGARIRVARAARARRVS